MRKYLTLLAVYSLALSGLVPAGFMITGAGPEGTGAAFVICTGSAPAAGLDGEGKRTPSSPHKSDAGICPFKVASTTAPLVPVFVSMPVPLGASERLAEAPLHCLSARHEVPPAGCGPPARVS